MESCKNYLYWKKEWGNPEDYCLCADYPRTQVCLECGRGIHSAGIHTFSHLYEPIDIKGNDDVAHIPKDYGKFSRNIKFCNKNFRVSLRKIYIKISKGEFYILYISP